MSRRQGIPPNPPYQGGQPVGRGDFFLPYNKALGPCAKELRKSMTEAEKKIWYETFRKLQYVTTRKNHLISCLKVGDIFGNDTITIVEVSV